MKPVPLSGTTPDLTGHSAFAVELLSDYTAFAFADVLPLADRGGDTTTLTYAYVMEVSGASGGNAVLFVTAEIKNKSDTCFLCVFDGDGFHHNYGPWDHTLGADAFVKRALKILRDRFKLA